MPEATQVAPATPTSETWNSNYPFNKNAYYLRCLTVEFKESKSGNPMLAFEWEIVNPAAKDIFVGMSADNKRMVRKMIVAGLKVPSWLAFTDKNWENVQKWHKEMGIVCPEKDAKEIDLAPYKDLIVEHIVSSEESVQLSDDINPVTGERLPINGADGKPIKKNFLRCGDMIRRVRDFTPSV